MTLGNLHDSQEFPNFPSKLWSFNISCHVEIRNFSLNLFRADAASKWADLWLFCPAMLGRFGYSEVQKS